MQPSDPVSDRGHRQPVSRCACQTTLHVAACVVIFLVIFAIISSAPPDDFNVIDHFFARAIHIDIPRRRVLAERLARQKTAKMGIALPEGLAPECLLEAMARIKRGIRP